VGNLMETSFPKAASGFPETGFLPFWTGRGQRRGEAGQPAAGLPRDGS